MKKITVKRAHPLLSAIILSMTLLLAATTAYAADSNVKLNDLDSSRWFYKDALYVVENQLMEGTSDEIFSPYDYVTRGQAVLILHRLCGEPEVVNEPTWTDVPDDSNFSEAVDWTYTYDISNGTAAEVFEPYTPLTRAQFAAMLYRYADYRYYDLSAKADCARFVDREDVPSYAGDAFNWAVSNGIISGTDEQALLPNAPVTRAQMAAMIARFDQCGFIRQQATSSGIKMIYPSDDQKTICPKRDFYVIGEFEDSVTLPADAVCNVQFTSNKTGERLRWVYSAQKDFKDGMYVDYQGFDYSGNREELRNSCMPDLVYDGKDLSTFKDTWRKCYFNDDVFTAIVYGGTYLQDINKYDQFGRELVEFPEGNYTLEITVTDASVINTYASYEDRIVIGTIPEKVLSPFAPQTHLDFLKRYAKEHDMVCFLDPFPGYWNTEMFLPDWNWDKDYEVEIVKRWSLADRQEYFTGHINFFNWNVPVTETSYAVEIGQLTYDHVLTDPNRLTTYYYSQGETSLPKTGESTFLKMDPVPSSADQQSVYLTRVDHNTPTDENVVDLRTLGNVDSDLDLTKEITLSRTDTIGINGICNVMVPDSVKFEADTESFTMSDRITSVRVTADGDAAYIVRERTIPVSLNRILEDGSTVVSIFEFKYNLKGNAFISSLKEPFTLTFTALNSAGEQIGAPATLKIVGTK